MPFPSNADLPSRTREYNGPLTRGARWDHYRPRPGDIIISAPAKSGMTWTQAICAMLIFGGADLDVQPARISPWFDSNFEPLAQMLQRLNAQTHRRYLKTHTPLDGLPYHPEVTYLAVYRHPLDAFYSAASLATTMAKGTVMPRNGQVRDVKSFMRAYLTADSTEGLAEQMTIGALAHHFKGFWDYRDLPNIHLLHYADLSRDLVGGIKSIGTKLGIAVDGAAAGAMASAASFSSMQKDARKFAPESNGSWKKPDDFFRGGGSGGWRSVLSEEDVSDYRRILADVLPDKTAAHWLENGGC
jgi:hypothetical protein